MSSYYGPMLYDWGYSTYSNPYYVPSSTVVVEQPSTVVVISNRSSTITRSRSTRPPRSRRSRSRIRQSLQFDQARDAFKNGDYTSALSLADQALVQLPNDPALHEFRSLVLFALQRYEEAAVAALRRSLGRPRLGLADLGRPLPRRGNLHGPAPGARVCTSRNIRSRHRRGSCSPTII